MHPAGTESRWAPAQSAQPWINFGGTFFATVAVVGVLTGLWPIAAFGALGLVTTTVATVWNRVSLEEVVYERRFPYHRALIGEELTMSLSLTNRKPVPLTWVRVEDEIPDELEVVEGDAGVTARAGAQHLRQSTSIGWYESVRWNYRLRCTRRGLFHLGPAYVESGDPFGFLHTRRIEAQEGSLIVYPRIVPLEELGIPAVRPLGDVRGGIRIFPDVSRPSGLRPYESGDPLNAVDWKSTARRQQLQVRTFEPSSTMAVVLVVAVDIAEPYWKSFSDTGLKLLERVITVTASVASYAADQQHTFGLFSNDMPILANRPMTIPMSRGPEQLSTVLGALATIRPFASGSMAVQLDQHSRRLPMGATLVVATAFLPPVFVDTLTDLRARGHRVVVTYVGDEKCPTLPDGVVLHDLGEYFNNMELRDEFGPR